MVMMIASPEVFAKPSNSKSEKIALEQKVEKVFMLFEFLGSMYSENPLTKPVLNRFHERKGAIMEEFISDVEKNPKLRESIDIALRKAPMDASKEDIERINGERGEAMKAITSKIRSIFEKEYPRISKWFKKEVDVFFNFGNIVFEAMGPDKREETRPAADPEDARRMRKAIYKTWNLAIDIFDQKGSLDVFMKRNAGFFKEFKYADFREAFIALTAVLVNMDSRGDLNDKNIIGLSNYVHNYYDINVETAKSGKWLLLHSKNQGDAIEGITVRLYETSDILKAIWKKII